MKKQAYFPENNRKISFFVTITSIVALLVSFGLLFFNASPFVSTWDQVDFALALNRFDLLAMQPHFPGYPYFILGGTIFHYLIESEAKALATFNVLLLLSSTIPIYLLLRSYLRKEFSFLAVAILLSSSYLLIIVAQPMSEGSALAVLWWYLWSIEVAKKADKFIFQIIPLFLFSILLGIRLSYIPFGVGIMLIWWLQLKKRQYPSVGILVILALFFQSIWIWALIITEGGFKSFYKLAIAFTDGHFGAWGGAITNNNGSLGARFYQLVVVNFFWNGIFAQSVVLLIIWCLLIFTASYLLIINKVKLDYWLAIQGGVYFLWIFLAQNVDKPRHILPAVGIFLFYIIVILVKERKNTIFIAMVISLVLQLSVNYTNLREQASKPPATYQMAQFVEKVGGNVVLYTWEETRVLQYLNASFIHKRVLTYDYFLQDKSNYQNKTILLTNHVVKGFEMEGIKINKQLEKVAEFRSNNMFDPVYHHLIIYKWKTK